MSLVCLAASLAARLAYFLVPLAYAAARSLSERQSTKPTVEMLSVFLISPMSPDYRLSRKVR
jgi:hypothetical protein